MNPVRREDVPLPASGTEPRHADDQYAHFAPCLAISSYFASHTPRGMAVKAIHWCLGTVHRGLGGPGPSRVHDPHHERWEHQSITKRVHYKYIARFFCNVS